MKLYMSTTSPYVRLTRIVLFEKGLNNVDTVLVNPWEDDPDFLEANTAARVPVLICDDGIVLTESLAIVSWLERAYPSPTMSMENSVIVSKLGVAMGVIDAAAHTLINQKTLDLDFLSRAVGERRIRSMVTGLEKLDSTLEECSEGVPNIAQISALVAYDYVNFRFGNSEWMPKLPRLEKLRNCLGSRESCMNTVPFV